MKMFSKVLLSYVLLINLLDPSVSTLDEMMIPFSGNEKTPETTESSMDSSTEMEKTILTPESKIKVKLNDTDDLEFEIKKPENLTSESLLRFRNLLNRKGFVVKISDGEKTNDVIYDYDDDNDFFVCILFRRFIIIIVIVAAAVVIVVAAIRIPLDNTTLCIIYKN